MHPVSMRSKNGVNGHIVTDDVTEPDPDFLGISQSGKQHHETHDDNRLSHSISSSTLQDF
jgi:hypothetical protein